MAAVCVRLHQHLGLADRTNGQVTLTKLLRVVKGHGSCILLSTVFEDFTESITITCVTVLYQVFVIKTKPRENAKLSTQDETCRCLAIVATHLENCVAGYIYYSPNFLSSQMH